MTLWSVWNSTAETTFTLPQNQEIYGVVATTIPYSSSAIGYFEIWASPRFIKRWTSAKSPNNREKENR
ncbi:MAG: hypothetical protein IJ868_06165 [Prevotella sp.]|nr:hypothetical protein [Prevotella sp.]